MADVNDMMAAYAKDAVEYAEQLKKELDYSEKSIQLVEEICTLLYNAIPRNFFQKIIRKTPSEETVIHMSKMLGGYIGEVMIKHYGGCWDIEDFMNQGNTVLVKTGELKTFPVSKVYKRLKNGPEDNVYYYYQVMTKELTRSS
ncbi:MAG: hypothetical protein JNK14_03725 [Chitinophagaceae bacterium]|nr:hypothetical protein [Chitinophagaceae bacterium]